MYNYIYKCNYNFQILLEKQMGWMLRENHSRNPCSLRTVELAYFLREGFTMIHSAKHGNPLLEALLIYK